MNTTLQTYLDKSIGVMQIADHVWFIAKDIFEMLDLVWRGADSLWQRQVPKEWAYYSTYKTNGGLQKTWFINENCIKKLITKSNKQSSELINIASFLGINIQNVILRSENEFIKILQAILSGSGLSESIETQFFVGKYKLDGYIKSHNMVIEYDEKYHNYTKEYDENREQYIIQNLTIKKDGLAFTPIIFRINEGQELKAIQLFTSFLFEPKPQKLQPNYSQNR